MARPNSNNVISEKEWMGQVIDLAQTFGWKHYHPWLSIHSAKGWPDLALCRERLILVELKTAKGKVSPSQQDWLGALSTAGVEVYVWRPADLDDVVRVLRQRREIPNAKS